MANKTAPGSSTDTPQAAKASGRVLGPKLKIAAFILGVAAIEWVVAYFYLPSVAPATNTAAGGRSGPNRPRSRDSGRAQFGPPRCLRRAC